MSDLVSLHRVIKEPKPRNDSVNLSLTLGKLVLRLTLPDGSD